MGNEVFAEDSPLTSQCLCANPVQTEHMLNFRECSSAAHHFPALGAIPIFLPFTLHRLLSDCCSKFSLICWWSLKLQQDGIQVFLCNFNYSSFCINEEVVTCSRMCQCHVGLYFPVLWEQNILTGFLTISALLQYWLLVPTFLSFSKPSYSDLRSVLIQVQDIRTKLVDSRSPTANNETPYTLCGIVPKNQTSMEVLSVSFFSALL